MRIEYDLTPEDWADFGEYCARTAPEFRRAIRRGLVSVALTAALLCAVLWQKTGSLVAVVVAAAFGLAWLFIWPNRLVSRATSTMRQRRSPCLTGRHILETTPDALLAKCDVAESTTRWAGVHHVAGTKRHVFVMLSSVRGYVIPRERVRAGDLEQFASEAQKYAGRHNLYPR